MILTQDISRTQIQSYITPKARLENRSLSGRGLFATEAIAKDELVVMWGGVVYRSSDLDSIPDELKHYLLQIDEELYIGPSSMENVDDAEYVNHSCNPNCGLRGQVALVAMRDIQAGEELTFDYAMAETYDQEWSCRCGSPSCRGSILGSDHNIPDIRKRYEGYFSSWLEKRHNSIVNDREYLSQFNETGAWGIVTALDLHDCNPETIRSADKIREFTYKLCDQIGVKRFGEPVIVNFGEDERVAGYSLVQLIETSLVSGHFANLTNRVYLDVFSCAYYNPNEVVRFSKEFFEAKNYNAKTYLRH